MGILTHPHHISFKHAGDGIIWAARTQPNFKIHLVLSLLAISAGLLVNLSNLEWVVIVFTIFWGLGAEMMNTVIEVVCDLITTDYRREIKIAKDVAAGMMLMTAIGALLVAFLIFVPKLL